jgi:peptidoglycan-associated lipoprotein
MRNFIRIPLTLTAISLLAACGSAIKLDDTPVESRVPVLVGSDSAGASGSASRSGMPGAAGAGGTGTAGRSGVAGGAGGAGGAGAAGAGSSGGAWGTGGSAGTAGTGGAAGAPGWGSGSRSGSGSGSGGAGGSAAGTALPSAVGDSRLASVTTVTPPPPPPPQLAPRDDPAALAPGLGRIVYFDFDSFVLRSDARPVVEGHARVLTADRTRRMVIEGHTDERGGREYNLALGQKRAEAVLRALVMLGASDAQLEAVSFGKERPAATGSDEAAWAQNRRAELKDRK